MAFSADLALDRRTGWPEDLQVLLRRHPRETWATNPDLGETARFWLRRHQMFRDLGAALDAGIGEYREGRIDAERFRGWFGRRLGFFLGELDGHHHIEDAHYFPLFQQAEARLARGFDVLEGDHETIHGDLERAADTANALLAALAAGRDARAAADAHAAHGSAMLGRLLRHLDDEEDLVVPLLLERRDLGM